MRQIAPTRKWSFLHDLESGQTERPAPTMFRLERAWSSASTPLSIVRPANHAVPPDGRNVFINNRQSTIAQHTTDFVQHESWVLRVMQHVTEQYGIEALIFDRKMTAIVRKIFDARGGVGADVQPNDGRTQQTLKMMCDETIAAADIEHVRLRREHAGDFKRHVICSTNLAPPSHAFEATFDRCRQTRHSRRSVQARCLED